VLRGVLLSTAFLPGNLLPGWIETVSRFNPVSWAAVAAQEAILHSEPDWGTIVSRVGLLTVFSIAATLLGTVSFRSCQCSI
jgi:ABC-2 type transport system permease protein